MAIYHSAYTFDANKFHADLESAIVKAGRLRYDILRNRAITIVKSASEDIMQALSHLRYGEGWLTDQEEEPHLWYLINLASVLKRAPALSYNRFRGSFHIMREVLPIAGWSEKEATELIAGKGLRQLLQAYGNALFLREFSMAFGGFLSYDDVLSQLAHLQSSKDYFSPASEHSIDRIAEFARQNLQDPRLLLEKAYADAIDMLQAAVERKEDMFLILD